MRARSGKSENISEHWNLASNPVCFGAINCVKHFSGKVPLFVQMAMAYHSPKTGLGGGYCRKSLSLKPITLQKTSHEIVSHLQIAETDAERKFN